MEIANTIFISVITAVVTSGLLMFIFKKIIENAIKMQFEEKLVKFRSRVQIDTNKHLAISNEQVKGYKIIDSKLYELRNHYRDIIEFISQNRPSDNKMLYADLSKLVDGYEKIPKTYIALNRQHVKELDLIGLDKEFVELLYKEMPYLESDFFKIIHDAKSTIIGLNFNIFLLLDFLRDSSRNDGSEEKEKLIETINQNFERLNNLHLQAKSFIRYKFGIN